MSAETELLFDVHTQITRTTLTEMLRGLSIAKTCRQIIDTTICVNPEGCIRQIEIRQSNGTVVTLSEIEK